jgi:PKD repeat protein
MSLNRVKWIPRWIGTGKVVYDMTPARDDSLELRSDIGSVLAQKKKSNKGIIIGAIVVVAILVIAGIVYYFIPRDGSDIKPVITIVGDPDPNELSAGMEYTFDARSSKSKNGMSPFAWDFGDGSTGTGIEVKHTFVTKGTYEVKLTVTDRNGKTGDAKLTVMVKGVIVTIPMGKLGDTCTYDFEGTVDINNPNGFWTYTVKKGPATFDIEVTEANIVISPKGEGMTVTTDASDAEDGYSQTHACVTRSTSQEMNFEGTAKATVKPRSGGSSKTTMPLSGFGTVAQTAYTDLTENRTINTYRSDDYTLNLGEAGQSDYPYTKEGSDMMNIFPKEREDFSVDQLKVDRTFQLNDEDFKMFDDTKMLWKVEAEDAVNDVPCLKVHIWMDQSSMAANGFESFDMYTWISNEFSMPLKAQIDSKGEQNGNIVEIHFTSTFIEHTEGDGTIEWGSCTASTSSGHFYDKRSGVSFGSPDDYAPAMGDSGSLSSYELPDAIDFAKGHSNSLKSYLNSNPGAFIANASCDEFTGTRTWDLYFGVTGSDTAYHIIVSKTAVIDDIGEQTVTPVGLSIKDISSALSFSEAEKVMNDTPAIETKVYSSTGSFKFSSYSFGCRSDVPFPAPDIPISTDFLGQGTEYYFYVENKDGTYSAGIDVQTGQILFIQTQ